MNVFHSPFFRLPPSHPGLLLAAGFWCAAAAAPLSTTVVVTDSEGRPVAGAIVKQYRLLETFEAPDEPPRLEATRTTDAAGAVVLQTETEGELTLVAEKTGLATAWRAWPASADRRDSTNEIVLTAAQAISGRVLDPAGKPIPDALVYVAYATRPIKRGVSTSWATLPRHLARQLFASRSRADGRFAITGLPEEVSLDLGVLKPGLALDRVERSHVGPGTLQFQAGETNVTLQLVTAGALEGRVVREDTGAPLSFARVFIAEPGFDAPAIPLTGADGIFRIHDLAPGDYRLRAAVGTNEFKDFCCEEVLATVMPGATNREVKLTATRGGVFSVSVAEEGSGKPLAGIQVHATASSADATAKTSPEGFAHLRLPPGDYYLYASGRNLGRDQTRASLETGETNQVKLTLRPMPKITGRVLDPEGKPASGVSIGLFPTQETDNQTDAQGRFTVVCDLERYGGMRDLTPLLIARDPARDRATVVEVEEGATNITVTLEPALRLTGKVTDNDGKPLPNAQVTLMFFTERIGASLGPPVMAASDGGYEIGGVPPGRRYAVSASAKGYGSATLNLDADVTATNRLALDPLKLSVANLPLAGVVVDADDKPVAGAHLWSYGDNQPQLSGRTDSKGRFSFRNVCAGPIQISASSPRGGGHGSVTAEGGDTNVTIQLGMSSSAISSRGSSKISGTVIGPDEKPVPKVRVSIFPFGSGEKLTDAAGRFTLLVDLNRFSGISDVPTVVIARDVAGNLAAAVEVEPGATNAQVKLEPALTVAGRVADEKGGPINNAQVSVMLRTERFGSSLGMPAKTDAEGQFELKGLPAGRRYSITASARGFGQDSRNVEPADTPGQRLELDPLQLPVADQRIAGVVLDADDKPVARAWIYAYGDKQPHVNTQTDAKGCFKLDQIVPGQVRLSANTSQGAYGSAVVEAGDTNITLRVTASGRRMPFTPATVKLAGKPLPELAPLGLSAGDVPADKPVLVLLLDAEQRPSRRALRLITEQAEALKQKGLAVVIIQAGMMTDEAFAAWKQDSALPFPVARFQDNPDRAKASWGAAALPWLILTDKTRKVIAEGFAPDELSSRLEALSQ